MLGLRLSLALILLRMSSPELAEVEGVWPFTSAEAVLS